MEQNAREAMQLAAVIGREFTHRLLDRISNLRSELETGLGELKTLELIFQTAYVPELAYMFKHALTHDVAYSTLLLERRKQLHRSVALTIEELYADRLPEQYETLAYHYLQAEEWERALVYALHAADKAAAAYANGDAISYYDQALELAQRLPGTSVETLMQIHSGRAAVALTMNRWEEVALGYEQLRAVAAGTGNREVEGLALGGIALGRTWSHEFDTARAAALGALALAERAAPEFGANWLERLEREHDNLRAALSWSLEPASGVEAIQRIETALRLSADLQLFWMIREHVSEGRALLGRALSQSEGIEGVAPSARARALKAAARLALVQGDYERGDVLAAQSLALCQQLDDTASIAFSLYLQGIVAWRKGKGQEARSLTEEALLLFRQVGDQERIAYALFQLASMASQQGDYTRGRTLSEETVTLLRHLGNQRGIVQALCQLAQILLVSQTDQATMRILLEESRTLSKHLGFKEGKAASLCLSAQLAMIEGDLTTACGLLGLWLVHPFKDGIEDILNLIGRGEGPDLEAGAAARAFRVELEGRDGEVDAAMLDVPLGRERSDVRKKFLSSNFHVNTAPALNEAQVEFHGVFNRAEIFRV